MAYHCVFNLLLFSTRYLDASCLVPFRKDKLKPSQDFKPSSCSNFQGSNLLDQAYFFVILSRMYSRAFNVLLWFCHGLPKREIIRFIFYVIGISYDKTHFTCIWVNSSRFKMIITSGYIENMKITQELLNKS